MATNNRPTNVADIESWLRAQAETQIAQIEADGYSRYPYLYGMSSMLLALAHAEIARLERKLAEAEADHAETLLASHFLEGK